MPLPLSIDDKNKIKRLIEEGVQTKQEISDLSEGLRDTVRAVAEELDLKPTLINKAINIAFKHNRDQNQEDYETIEELLDIANR